jgi:hypothetical protein
LFAIGGLRRSRSIEQFLRPAFHDGRQGIRWVSIEPQRDGDYAIVLYLAEDMGGEHFADLLEFPPLDRDADEDGQVLARTGDEREVLEKAEALTGAVRDRWANFGVAAEDYLEYVRSGRLPHPLTQKAAVEILEDLRAAPTNGSSPGG